MTVKEIVQALDLEVCAGEQQLAREVTGGCVSDLLSYVMGSAAEGHLWLTIQVHPNVVGVASLLDLSAVLIADGQTPDEDTLAKAQEHQLPLLTSQENAFTLAGQLYQLGVR